LPSARKPAQAAVIHPSSTVDITSQCASICFNKEHMLT
jgi:hypothetical protein